MPSWLLLGVFSEGEIDEFKGNRKGGIGHLQIAEMAPGYSELGEFRKIEQIVAVSEGDAPLALEVVEDGSRPPVFPNYYIVKEWLIDGSLTIFGILESNYNPPEFEIECASLSLVRYCCPEVYVAVILTPWIIEALCNNKELCCLGFDLYVIACQ